MKNTIKLTCCGIISALAVVLMLATNIPIMLYTVPAATGILFMIPAIEFSTKWAWLCYIVTCIISFVFPVEREAFVVFIGFFGYYPIVKLLTERFIKKTWILKIIKFIIFNIAIIGCYLVVIYVLGINPLQNDAFSFKTIAVILLLAGNIAFAIYDYALTKLIILYFVKLRKVVRKSLGIKGKH